MYGPSVGNSVIVNWFMRFPLVTTAVAAFAVGAIATPTPQQTVPSAIPSASAPSAPEKAVQPPEKAVQPPAAPKKRVRG